LCMSELCFCLPIDSVICIDVQNFFFAQDWALPNV